MLVLWWNREQIYVTQKTKSLGVVVGLLRFMFHNYKLFGEVISCYFLRLVGEHISVAPIILVLHPLRFSYTPNSLDALLPFLPSNCLIFELVFNLFATRCRVR